MTSQKAQIDREEGEKMSAMIELREIKFNLCACIFQLIPSEFIEATELKYDF